MYVNANHEFRYTVQVNEISILLTIFTSIYIAHE